MFGKGINIFFSIALCLLFFSAGILCVGVHGEEFREKAEMPSDAEEGSVSENDGTVSGDDIDNGRNPENPVHHHTGLNDGTDTTTWSYVYFGSYPQSEVTDDAIKSEIDSAIARANLKSSGSGIDIWINNTKYRRISKYDCNHGEYFNEVDNKGYRYFKWERIRWSVLNNNGSVLFLASDKGLDCRRYHNSSAGVTWESSSIRKWLNESFFNTAFSEEEQQAIVTGADINIDNDSHNTTDKVYLLSIEDAVNESYGFCNDYGVYSASRWKQISSYTRARGCYTYKGSYTGDNLNCWWWLRSSGYDSANAADVHANGYINKNGYSVCDGIDAVVPALYINLDSDLWLVTDDETSGFGGGSDSIQDSEQNNDQSDVGEQEPGKQFSVDSAAYIITKTGTDNTVEWQGGSASQKSVNIPDVILYNGKSYRVTSIADHAFEKNNNLQTIKLGKNIQRIGTSAFAKCKNLKSVTLSGADLVIADRAFYKCVSLRKISFSGNAAKIGKEAFKGCKNLKIIKFKGKKAPVFGKNCFKGINNMAVFDVPKNSIKTYKKKLTLKTGFKKSMKIK